MMPKPFVLEGEQRIGVLLALAAVARIPGGGRSWNERLYRNGIVEAEQTLCRMLGIDSTEAARAEIAALPRTARGAAKRAARGDV